MLSRALRVTLILVLRIALILKSLSFSFKRSCKSWMRYFKRWISRIWFKRSLLSIRLNEVIKVEIDRRFPRDDSLKSDYTFLAFVDRYTDILSSFSSFCDSADSNLNYYNHVSNVLRSRMSVMSELNNRFSTSVTCVYFLLTNNNLYNDLTAITFFEVNSFMNFRSLTAFVSFLKFRFINKIIIASLL